MGYANAEPGFPWLYMALVWFIGTTLNVLIAVKKNQNVGGVLAASLLLSPKPEVFRPDAGEPAD